MSDLSYDEIIRKGDLGIREAIARLIGFGPNGEPLGITTTSLNGVPKFSCIEATASEARLIVPERRSRIGGVLVSFHSSATVYASYQEDFVAAMGEQDTFPITQAAAAGMMGGRLSILLTNSAYYVRAPLGATNGLVYAIEVLPYE